MNVWIWAGMAMPTLSRDGHFRYVDPPIAALVEVRVRDICLTDRYSDWTDQYRYARPPLNPSPSARARGAVLGPRVRAEQGRGRAVDVDRSLQRRGRHGRAVSRHRGVHPRLPPAP